jgi:uncharacterized membrane protein YhhN
MHVYKSVGVTARRQFVTGALFFVVSDSLLAINKFYQAFPFAGLLIMLTYCAAQYFIVRGFMSHVGKIANS